MYNPYDFYFKKAKKEWYKARSAFKLEEIQNKFKILNADSKNIVDLWCSPGSWMQYSFSILKKIWHKFKILWFDLKNTDVSFPNVKTFVQDITDVDKMKKIFISEWFTNIDVILSDMAPNTTWLKDIDAIRLFNIVDDMYWIFDSFLSEKWKFVIKVFMWPWFAEFIQKLKKRFWAKNIKVFKPQACRKNSKETYVIKFK